MKRSMYKVVPFLLATTSWLICLWRFEHQQHSDWRSASFQESQLTGSPIRFRGISLQNITITSSHHQSNILPTTRAATKMLSVGNRRLSARNTTIDKCTGSTDPALCSYLRARLNCSCDNDIGEYYCCQRSILVVHKMGVTLVQSLAEKHLMQVMGRPVPTPEITSHRTVGTAFRFMFDTPRLGDYRHVVVTRNWYDAIISGYLYHQSGKECWLDWYGRPNHDGWLLNNKLEDWEHTILHNDLTFQWNLTWNPGNGRDLCRYLLEESEDVGLRVYTAWALATYMMPLFDFRHRRQQREDQKGWKRTKYVCYEQLTDYKVQSKVFDNMGQWLFPDETDVMFNMTNDTFSDNKTAGHASDQDPVLRKRLNDALRVIDRNTFGRFVEKGNAQFGCGGEDSDSRIS